MTLTLTDRMVSYLAEMLDDTRVCTEIPHDRKSLDRLVVLARIGGTPTAFVDEPSYRVDCYARSDALAEQLAWEVNETLLTWPELDGYVSMVWCDTLYQNEYLEESDPCYTARYGLVVNV